MKDAQNGLYAIIIPGYIANREDLTRTEKYIFGIVSGLAYKEGYCYASNYYLAQKAGCSKKTITRTVSKIEKLNLWRVDVKTYIKNDEADPKQLGTVRKITPFQLEEMSRGVDTSVQGGGHQCPGGVDTSVQHSNKDSIKDSSSSSSRKTTTTELLNTSSMETFKEELIQLLNDKKNREPLEKIFEEQKSVYKQNVKITDQMKGKLLEKFRLFNLNRRLTKEQCLEYLYKFAQIEDYNKLYDQIHS